MGRLMRLANDGRPRAEFGFAEIGTPDDPRGDDGRRGCGGRPR